MRGSEPQPTSETGKAAPGNVDTGTVAAARYFDSRAAEWSEHYADDPRFARRMAKIGALLERYCFSQKLTGRAIDFGCGSGVFTRMIASHAWSVVGLDASQEMIEHARAASAKLITQGASISYQSGSIDTLGTIDGERDLVISLSVLEYIENDTAALRALAALVAKGGIVVLSVPNRRSLLRRLERAIFRVRMLSGDRIFSGRGEYLKVQRHQYTARELDDRMMALGFVKQEGSYLNAGFSRPKQVALMLESPLWAAMYVGVYRKQAR